MLRIYLVLVSLLFANSLFAQKSELTKIGGRGLKPDSYEMVSTLKEANPGRIAHRGLPSSVDLAEFMPPIGNQGSQGSCVAWSTAYANKSFHEYMERKSKGTWSYTNSDGSVNYKYIFSPAFIYNQINGGRDNGSSISDAMALMVSKGAVPWEVMPYDQKNYTKQPTQQMYQAALKYKAKEFQRVRYNEPEEVKSQLAKGRPVVVGILISEGFYELGKQVYNESTTRGQNLGGHAITLIGYDDSRQVFKFQNSWSKSWGDNGYGYISYKYLAKVCRSAFVMIDDVAAQEVVQEETTTDPQVVVVPETTTDVTQDEIELLPPSEINATTGNFSDKVVLTWNPPKGAIGYEIYRTEADADSYQKVGLAQSALFEDTGVLPDIAYSYKIASVSESSITDMSDATAIGYATAVKNDTPAKITSIMASDGKYPDKIVVQWEALSNITGYQVYKWDGNAKIYKPLGKVNQNTTYYEDKSAKKNGAMEAYVVAGLNGNIVGYASDVAMGKTSISQKPAAPENVIASMGQYRDKIVVSWKKVPGAVGYLVYRYDSQWNVAGETTEEKLEDNITSKGRNYYTVVARNKDNVWGSYSAYAMGFIDKNLKRGNTKLQPPENVTVTVDKKTETATLYWNEVKGAFEYNVWVKKRKDSKWKFLNRVEGKTLTTVRVPEKDEFYMYSVTSKPETGGDSEWSKPVSVVLSNPKQAVKSRSFGQSSKLEKFKGTWTALQWDGNTGTKNVIMEIESEDNNSVTVKIDNKKQYTVNYVQGSPVLDIDGKIKIKLSSGGDALTVELKDKSVLNEKGELSFLKE